MKEGWLRVFELYSHVSSESEIWILVYGTRDKAGYIGDLPVNLRERVRKGGRGLNRDKVDLANIVTTKHERKRRRRTAA